MSDKLREYHDALVRLDALREQLRRHVLAAQAGWLGDDEGPPDFLKPFEDIEIRMDEVIPDAVKATRVTAQQRAAMIDAVRCPDCTAGGVQMTEQSYRIVDAANTCRGSETCKTILPQYEMR